MKILPIKGCDECHHAKYDEALLSYFCELSEREDNQVRKLLVGGTIEIRYEHIPDWCPLDEYEEAKNEGRVYRRL